MTFHVGATANGSSRRYGINVTSDRAFMVADINPQNYYANAHSYLDEPLKQLVKLIPELKRIRLELNQQMLPVIIEKTGITVDDFFHNVPSLIADEEVTQQRVTSSIGALNAKQHVRDNYLILVRGDKNSAHLDEFRMDPKGNRVEQLRTDKQDYVVPSQFFVTSGFALSCIYFATALQSESTFRYLGEESIGKQDTYVVGFAQRPAEAATTVTMRGSQGADIHLLVQGIAWIDKSNFQIIRLRTDLLAPRPEIELDSQTTEVNFSEVRLRDVTTPLWLPSVVNVYVTFYQHNFRNEHHYKDYRRYRVSAGIVSPK